MEGPAGDVPGHLGSTEGDGGGRMKNGSTLKVKSRRSDGAGDGKQRTKGLLGFTGVQGAATHRFGKTANARCEP